RIKCIIIIINNNIEHCRRRCRPMLGISPTFAQWAEERPRIIQATPQTSPPGPPAGHRADQCRAIRPAILFSSENRAMSTSKKASAPKKPQDDNPEILEAVSKVLKGYDWSLVPIATKSVKECEFISKILRIFKNKNDVEG
ncbi:unnamed protein product, partial [Nesidiocoris tenuis]